jgi:7,8-dihydropterin-6-yl-methyl-4-(beta-D-ribofuranosyl)aminobenzene 5'-phosphate synthase
LKESGVVRVTTLMDNTAASGFFSEWGLSLLIEAGGKRVLFDTGGSPLLLKNAHRAGVSLSHLDAIVLSHGHADHTGGLMAVLHECAPVPVVGHPDIFSGRLVLRPGDTVPESIGIPFSRAELESAGAEFMLSRGPTVVFPGLITSGEIPMLTVFEKIDTTLMISRNGILEADEVLDDQCIIVTTPIGLLVINGCAHHGVTNALVYAMKITGISKIAAVAGGMHLMRSEGGVIQDTIEILKKMDVQRVIASHCTGAYATERLQESFGRRCAAGYSGFIFEVASPS